MVYESIQHQNKQFVAEFLYSIDTRIQIWLNQCKAACDREEVNDNLINFSDDLDKVLLCNFSVILPHAKSTES